MKKRQADELVWLRRIILFLRANANVLRCIERGWLLARVEELVAQLLVHRSEQVHFTLSARAATAGYHAARQSLAYGLLVPLVELAPLVVNDPRLMDTFKRPVHNAPAEQLIAAARAMAIAAQPYEEAFVAAGMPANFRARLGSTSAAILAALETRARFVRCCMQATSEISDKLGEARWAVRVIDSLVRAEAMNNPSLRRVWSTLRVVPAYGRRVGGQAPVSAAA